MERDKVTAPDHAFVPSHLTCAVCGQAEFSHAELTEPTGDLMTVEKLAKRLFDAGEFYEDETEATLLPYARLLLDLREELARAEWEGIPTRNLQKVRTLLARADVLLRRGK